MNNSYLEHPSQVHLNHINTPEIKEDEVLVKISSVGICGSDVHLFTGHRTLSGPIPLGHEAVGIITEVGESISASRIGERVVIEPNICCGTCQYCQRGRTEICESKKTIGLTLPGCFAEYLVIESDFAHPIAKTLSEDDAVTIEPTAVAYHALRIAELPEKSSIAVLGLGAVGLLLTHLATVFGHQVYAADPFKNKCLKAEELGALSFELTPTNSSELKSFWNEQKIQTIFECAGSKNAAPMALENAPRGARVILIGLSEASFEIQPLHLVRNGIQLLTSIIYSHPTDFKEVIALIEENKINPGTIVTQKRSFQELQNAMMEAVTGVESKIVIQL